MNVKPAYKTNPYPYLFDEDYDSYCSLISWKDFTQNISKYIAIAESKRDHTGFYDLVKRM